MSHQNYVIRTRILYFITNKKDTTQDNCLYNIPYIVSPTKPYLSGLHISYNYIAQNTYLLKPHRKGPTILYHLETFYPTTSPPTRLHTSHNYYVLNKHSTLYIISTTLSKNKQTQILTNTTYITKMQPTLYPYITTYKKLTNPPLTQYQNTKINTKPIHTPTHPQTNLPPLQINPYQQINTKTKTITLPNKYTKKHQINFNHPLNHLKRARPTGLAPF